MCRDGCDACERRGGKRRGASAACDEVETVPSLFGPMRTLSPVLRAETMARPVMMSLFTAVPATLAKAASSCGSAKMAVAVSRSEAAVRTRARRLLVQLGCKDGEGGGQGGVSRVRSKAEAVRRRGRAFLVFSRVGRPPLLSPLTWSPRCWRPRPRPIRRRRLAWWALRHG